MPKVLFNQFKFFFNLFFLLVAISQIFEALRVGFLVSFVAPLIFVLTITMLKEGYDDYKRLIRDREINDLIYERLDINGGKILKTKAKNFEVGDLIKVSYNQRVPVDMVLLYTTDKSGSVFIRTD